MYRTFEQHRADLGFWLDASDPNEANYGRYRSALRAVDNAHNSVSTVSTLIPPNW